MDHATMAPPLLQLNNPTQPLTTNVERPRIIHIRVSSIQQTNRADDGCK